MKTNNISIIAALAIGSGLLLVANSLRAETIVTTQPVIVSPAPVNDYETIAFSDSAEAGMMINAYDILATGDHDYKGHRAKAMRQIEAAAKLLGVTLHGNDKDRQRQVLSDDKMREAQSLLTSVLNNAEVKGQPRVTKRISEAINQISIGLSEK